MAKIKKGDYVQVKYIGRLKDSNQIFDLNDEEVAKKEGMYNPKLRYKPFTVCVGKRDVVKGLDDSLVGKTAGNKFSVDLKSEDAFGKQNPKFFQLVSASKFKDSNIKPYPGMPVTINKTQGVVKTISGGRVMVDFNHPLAGKDVKYDVEVLKLVDDDAEKVKAIAELHLGISNAKVTVTDGVAHIDQEFPKQLVKAIEKSIIDRVPSLKSVEFKVSKK